MLKPKLVSLWRAKEIVSFVDSIKCWPLHVADNDLVFQARNMNIKHANSVVLNVELLDTCKW